MFFPGPQPRDFVFRCLSCNAETQLDESFDGLCVICANEKAEAERPKPPKKISHAERKRRAEIRKTAARVRHAKRCRQSTTTKGEKTFRGKTSNH